MITNISIILRLAMVTVMLVSVCLPLDYVYSQAIAIPTPKLLHLSQPIEPVLLKGIKVDPAKPLKLEFIVTDTVRHPERSEGSLIRDPRLRGDDTISSRELEAESRKLVKYFLAALTTPEKDLWVNLSPHEPDRIVDDDFGQTAMGRDLLAQDYLLKQLTASLLHPDNEYGKKFWERVYAEAFEEYGTTDIPVDTLHKVWIVPDEAAIFEKTNDQRPMTNEHSAEPNGKSMVNSHSSVVGYVTKAKLKVMLERDYVAAQQTNDQRPMTNEHSAEPNEKSIVSGHSSLVDAVDLSTDVMRSVIIPAIEEEVNTGTHFAPLRQIYHSLILATWYKKKMKESVLSQAYVDQGKSTGKRVEGKEIETIYEQYVQSFKEGVYDFVVAEQQRQPSNVISQTEKTNQRKDRMTYDPMTYDHEGNKIPRRYFSGGVDAAMMSVVLQQADVSEVPKTLDNAQVIEVDLKLESDAAMSTSQRVEFEGITVWEDEQGKPFFQKVPPISKSFDAHTSGKPDLKRDLYTTSIGALQKMVAQLNPEVQQQIQTGNMLVVGPGNHPYEILMLLDLFPEVKSITVLDRWQDNFKDIERVLKEIGLPEALLDKVHFHFGVIGTEDLELSGLNLNEYDLVYSDGVIDSSLFDSLDIDWVGEKIRLMVGNIIGLMREEGVFVTNNSDERAFNDFRQQGFVLRDQDGNGDDLFSQFIAVKDRKMFSDKAMAADLSLLRDKVGLDSWLTFFEQLVAQAQYPQKSIDRSTGPSSIEWRYDPRHDKRMEPALVHLARYLQEKGIDVEVSKGINYTMSWSVDMKDDFDQDARRQENARVMALILEWVVEVVSEADLFMLAFAFEVQQVLARFFRDHDYVLQTHEDAISFSLGDHSIVMRIAFDRDVRDAFKAKDLTKELAITEEVIKEEVVSIERLVEAYGFKATMNGNEMEVVLGGLEERFVPERLVDVGLERDTFTQWFLVQSRLRAAGFLFFLPDSYVNASLYEGARDVFNVIDEHVKGFLSQRWVKVDQDAWDVLRDKLLSAKQKFDELDFEEQDIKRATFEEFWRVLVREFNALKHDGVDLLPEDSAMTTENGSDSVDERSVGYIIDSLSEKMRTVAILESFTVSVEGRDSKLHFSNWLALHMGSRFFMSLLNIFEQMKEERWGRVVKRYQDNISRFKGDELVGFRAIIEDANPSVLLNYYFTKIEVGINLIDALNQDDFHDGVSYLIEHTGEQNSTIPVTKLFIWMANKAFGKNEKGRANLKVLQETLPDIKRDFRRLKIAMQKELDAFYGRYPNAVRGRIEGVGDSAMTTEKIYTMYPSFKAYVKAMREEIEAATRADPYLDVDEDGIERIVESKVALYQDVEQLMSQLPDDSPWREYLMNAVDVPVSDVLHYPGKGDGGVVSSTYQVNYYTNFIDARSFILTFIVNFIVDGFDVIAYQSFLNQAHRVQLVGRNKDSFYLGRVGLPQTLSSLPAKERNFYQEVSEGAFDLRPYYLQNQLPRGFYAFKKYLQLSQEASLEEVLGVIAAYYYDSFAGSAFGLGSGNQSFFMNIVNTMLRLKGFDGISHQDLDGEWESRDRDDFVQYFINQVGDAAMSAKKIKHVKLNTDEFVPLSVFKKIQPALDKYSRWTDPSYLIVKLLNFLSNNTPLIFPENLNQREESEDFQRFKDNVVGVVNLDKILSTWHEDGIVVIEGSPTEQGLLRIDVPADVKKIIDASLWSPVTRNGNWVLSYQHPQNSYDKGKTVMMSVAEADTAMMSVVLKQDDASAVPQTLDNAQIVEINLKPDEDVNDQAMAVEKVYAMYPSFNAYVKAEREQSEADYLKAIARLGGRYSYDLYDARFDAADIKTLDQEVLPIVLELTRIKNKLIKQKGLKPLPILVYQYGIDYFIMDGDHRWYVAKKSGAEIEAFLVEVKRPDMIGWAREYEQDRQHYYTKAIDNPKIGSNALAKADYLFEHLRIPNKEIRAAIWKAMPEYAPAVREALKSDIQEVLNLGDAVEERYKKILEQTLLEIENADQAMVSEAVRKEIEAATRADPYLRVDDAGIERVVDSKAALYADAEILMNQLPDESPWREYWMNGAIVPVRQSVRKAGATAIPGVPIRGLIGIPGVISDPYQINYYSNYIDAGGPVLAFILKGVTDGVDQKDYRQLLNQVHRLQMIGRNQDSLYMGVVQARHAAHVMGAEEREMWIRFISQGRADLRNTDFGESIIKNGFAAFQEYLDLPSDASRRDVLRAVVRYYKAAFWPLFGVGGVNNSVFMNIINVMLVLKGVDGIEHGVYDLVVREISEEDILQEFYDKNPQIEHDRSMFTTVREDIDSEASPTGGVDLGGVSERLEVGRDVADVAFEMDAAMMAQLEEIKNATGLLPVIVGARPLVDLHGFLGI